MITRLDVLLTHQKMATAHWEAARRSGEPQWLAYAEDCLAEVDLLLERERTPSEPTREPQRLGAVLQKQR